jgi:hypothetical protein
MDEQVKMYRAWAYFGGLSVSHPESEASVFTTDGVLSDCRKWIDIRTISADKQRTECQRCEVSSCWQPTRELAKSVLSDQIRQIGERLIRQAQELESAAHAEAVQ